MKTRSAEIVACTIGQLQRFGYDGVSFGSIARELAISKGVLTYHFPTKLALMEAVLTTVVERYQRDFDSSNDAVSQESRGYLRLYVTQALRHMAEAPQDLVALLEIGEHVPDHSRPARLGRAFERRASRTLVRILRDGQERGVIRPCDPELAAIAIKAILDHQLRRWSKARPTRANASKITQELVTLIEHAVQA